MIVLIWYLVKSDASVRYYTVAYTGQWTCQILQGTNNTRPFITVPPVPHQYVCTL